MAERIAYTCRARAVEHVGRRLNLFAASFYSSSHRGSVVIDKEM